MTGRDGKAVIAVDLGGTRFRVAVFEGDDGPPALIERHASEAEQGPEHVFQLLEKAISGVREKCELEIAAIGVAAPGPLDPWKGIVYPPPNMPGWADETPLARIVEEMTGIPAVIGNDANLAAVGEHRYGAGKGVSDLVYLTISTGIGGGVIIDNRLFLGAHGLAAELGHVIIDPSGPICGCGGRGHLEAFASGTSIAKVARARLLQGVETSITTGDATTTEDIVAAALAGDAFARHVFINAASLLGIGVTGFLHTFDPALIVLGGGVTNAGDFLLDVIRGSVKDNAMPRYRNTPIVRAALGDDSGLYGAAAIARDRIALG